MALAFQGTSVGRLRILKIYFAGNFPQLLDRKWPWPLNRGQFICDWILSFYSDYRRLISFYFREEIMIVLDLKKNESLLRRR